MIQNELLTTINDVEFVEKYVVPEYNNRKKKYPLIGLNFRLSSDNDIKLTKTETENICKILGENIKKISTRYSRDIWADFENQTVYTEFDDYDEENYMTEKFYVAKKNYLESELKIPKLPNDIGLIDTEKYVNNLKIAVGPSYNHEPFDCEKYWYGIVVGRTTEELNKYKNMLENDRESCVLDIHKKHITNMLSEIKGRTLYNLKFNVNYEKGMKKLTLGLQLGPKLEDIFYIQLFCPVNSYDDNYDIYLSYNGGYVLSNDDNEY